jgi:hypothetical protein
VQITYELNAAERAVLTALAMVSWSPLPESIALNTARLVLLSEYSYVKLVDAAVTQRGEWDRDRDKLAAEIGRAIPALVALRLIERSETTTKTKRLVFQGASFLRHVFLGGKLMEEQDVSETTVELTLTSEGRRIATAVLEGRAAQLRPPHDLRRTVFVASAFGQTELERLYERELVPACATLGLTPVRVDLTEPRQTITARILEGIRDCRIMIADLTYARPSVYFEVGVAHGLGIPLVLTCRADHLRNMDDSQRLHFDLAQYKISFWKLSREHEFEWPDRMKPTDRLQLAERELRVQP